MEGPSAGWSRRAHLPPPTSSRIVLLPPLPHLPLLAAATGEDTPLSLPSPSGSGAAAASGGGSVLRTLLALLVVAALIYAVAWALRRVRGERVPVKSGRGRGPLKAEATLTLAPQRSVHVVRAGREVLVVGVADHSVSLLRSCTEEEALELGLIAPADDEAPAAPRLPDLRAGRAVRASALPTGALVSRLRELTVRS